MHQLSSGNKFYTMLVSTRILLSPELLFLVLSLTAHLTTGLQCHECSDQFSTKWEPRACQLNASLVPVRDCLQEQTYCFVERVTVKGIVTVITRDCTEDCLFGCTPTGFGITSLTCTSCCNTDRCNTMDSCNTIRAGTALTTLLVFISVFLGTVQ